MGPSAFVFKEDILQVYMTGHFFLQEIQFSDEIIYLLAYCNVTYF